MDKKKVILISIITFLVIFTGVGLALFFTSREKPTPDIEEESSEVIESSTEVDVETQTEQESTEIANNTDNDVQLTIDFKFDTKVSGDYLIFDNAVEEEEDIFEIAPWLTSRVRKEVDGNNGWIYLNSDIMQSLDDGLYVSFHSDYSNIFFKVNEVPSTMSYDEIKSQVYRDLLYFNLKIGERTIPFGTPYVLGEGFVNPERFYTQAPDGSYGKECMNSQYQILCEDSVETKIGTVYFMSWYGFTENQFYLGGYVRNNSGRTFVFNASDSTDQYFLAYISEIFDKCIVIVD